jgi:hypothetical protein
LPQDARERLLSGRAKLLSNRQNPARSGAFFLLDLEKTLDPVGLCRLDVPRDPPPPIVLGHDDVP